MIISAVHRRDLVGGARAMIPWLLGVAPFGLVIGVSSAQAEMPTLVGVLTGPAIYSGSSQVATIELLSAGAAPLVIVGTALIINVRLILYSAAMATYWRDTPLWWRLGAAYLLIDPSFAVGMDGYARSGPRREAHAHYLGGAILLWAGWLAAIAIGAAVGTALPAALHLEFVIPLYLIGEIVPRLRSVAIRRTAAVAAIVSLAAFSAPLHLGLAVAIVAGLAAGLTSPSKLTPNPSLTEEGPA
jgi:predicted branched-subunit amino acid permease